MSPDEANAKVRALSRPPEPSLVGWQVVTEPKTTHAERWTIYADLPPGLVHEERTLYLRSDASGEVIMSDLPSLADCDLTVRTMAGRLRVNWE
jgi:hypothetical protein